MMFLARGMSVEKKKVLLLAKNICMGVILMNKNSNEKEIYRRKIAEMVEKIENLTILESIYSFIMGILSMKEKQGAD